MSNGCSNGIDSMLIVEDTGNGIDPMHRKLVFNRIYRVSDTGVGSGLGLAIVRDIAQDYGVHVTITSTTALIVSTTTSRYFRHWEKLRPGSC